jgi:hypothetical protein
MGKAQYDGRRFAGKVDGLYELMKSMALLTAKPTSGRGCADEKGKIWP